MATIILDMGSTITGSSNLTGYVGKMPCEVVRDSLYSPKPTTTGTSNTTVNKALHSDIAVVRYRDSASPKLAAAASSGTLFGTIAAPIVKITLFRTESSTTTKYMEYELGAVYISRYESGTLDADGLEFEPYVNPSDPMPPPSWGLAALLGATSTLPAGVRQAPRPVRGGARGLPAASNKELERVWLNAGSVKWTYTLTSGSVSAGWNITTGASIA